MADCGIDEAAYVEKGVLTDSGPFDGLTSEQAFDAIADWLAERGKGEKRVNFRLRDWGVSRQRYWGCPIPVVHTADGEHPPGDRPPGPPARGRRRRRLRLAAEEDGILLEARQRRDPRDRHLRHLLRVQLVLRPLLLRDCDTAMLDERANYWLPVDQYVGGIEHAVLHLLYARFFHKLMRDEGLVDCDEPFTKPL
jgi:leucyl-tRNA synthetase